MKRGTVLDQIENTREPWDFLLIGGGATGLGVAVDAAARAGTARCWCRWLGTWQPMPCLNSGRRLHFGSDATA